MQRPWISGLVLIVLLIAFRCLGSAYAHALPGFSPLPALFLCSVIFLRGKQAWGIPLAAWMISNPLASALQGYHPFEAGGGVIVAFIALMVTAALALLLRKSPSPLVVLGGSLVAALLFHGITNVVIWAADPLYVKSAHGLWQSLWTGRPSDALPSWVFLRNLGAANVLFTAVFLLAQRSWSVAPGTLPGAQKAR